MSDARVVPELERLRVGRAVVAVAVLAVGLTAVAALPGGFWAAGLVASFRPQLAVLGLVTLVGLATARPRRVLLLAGLTAVAVALNVVPVVPLFAGGRDVTAGAPRLRIAHLNVKIFNEDVAAMRAFLHSDPGDVVVLIETSPQVEEALRQDTSYDEVWPRPDGPRTDMAVFARVPVDDLDAVWLDPDGRRAATSLRVPLGAESVRVLAVHPLSPRSPRAAASRDRDLRAAGGWAAAQRGPTAVLGDFNATPWSPVFHDLLHRGGLVDSARGHGLQASWSPGLPLLSVPIDQLVTTPDLVATRRELGPSAGSSDHRSLEVTLAPVRG